MLEVARGLELEIQSQKRQCGHVDTEDTGRIQFCQQWLDRLREQYSIYIKQLKSYEEEIAQKAKAQLDRSISDLLQDRSNEISYLKKRISIWQKALSDLQKNQNYQESLSELAKESEEAQIDAISSATSYLMGPLSDIIKQAARDGTLAWSEYLRVKPALERAQEQLVKNRRVWSKYQVLKPQVEQLQAELALAKSVLQNSDNVREVGGVVETFGKRTKAIVASIKLVQSPLEKQDLLAAMAELQKTSYALLKNAGLDRVIAEAGTRGMETVVKRANVIKFVAEYSAAAAKFGVAWVRINQINEAIDDRNRLALTMALHIHQDEDRRQAIATEVKELNSALAGDRLVKEEALRIFHARELQASYREGDWFSVTTGVRAPGSPILGK